MNFNRKWPSTVHLDAHLSKNLVLVVDIQLYVHVTLLNSAINKTFVEDRKWVTWDVLICFLSDLKTSTKCFLRSFRTRLMVWRHDAGFFSATLGYQTLFVRWKGLWTLCYSSYQFTVSVTYHSFDIQVYIPSETEISFLLFLIVQKKRGICVLQGILYQYTMCCLNQSLKRWMPWAKWNSSNDTHVLMCCGRYLTHFFFLFVENWRGMDSRLVTAEKAREVCQWQEL